VSWDKLTEESRKDAMMIGYNKQKWDLRFNEDEDDDDEDFQDPVEFLRERSSRGTEVGK